jgi:hypothetical protein
MRQCPISSDDRTLAVRPAGVYRLLLAAAERRNQGEQIATSFVSYSFRIIRQALLYRSADDTQLWLALRGHTLAPKLEWSLTPTPTIQIGDFEWEEDPTRFP